MGSFLILVGFLTHAPYCDVLHYDCQEYQNDSNPAYLGPFYDTNTYEFQSDEPLIKDEIELESEEYLAKIEPNEGKKPQAACDFGYLQSRQV